MNHIDTHLHRLFLDHDCVVVPGLGGFVCNRVPARYDSTREELIPPTRDVMFNERLIHHDGVLAQSVAMNEGLIYAEAVQLIEREAGDLKRRVQAGETVIIEHVGRLYRNPEGGMMFMPEEVLERMLRSFGLQRIPLRPLLQPQLKEVENPRVLKMESAGNYAGPRPWARVAAAMAVPILGGASMFIADQWESEVSLMSALPLFSERVESTTFQPRFEEEAVLLSGVSTKPVFEFTIEAAQAAEGASVVQYDFTEEAVSPLGTSVILGDNTTQTSLAPSIESVAPEAINVFPSNDAVSSRMFALVAGAFSIESNAQRMARSLRKEGFNSEIFLQANGLHVVTYAAFDQESDARKKLVQLRDNKRWSNAWLKRFEA